MTGAGTAGGLIVFDGDDTLWLVEALYDEARSLARAFVESLGVDGDRWETFERDIDVRNVEVLGLDPRRFPTSCVQAYEKLAGQSGTVDEAAKDRIWKLANTVFDRPAPLVEGAEDVLRQLQSQCPIVLLTRGHETVQRKRIEESGLSQYFDAIHIVPDKDAFVFRNVLNSAGALRERSWSIGNSLPSDIYPALEMGMGAIWVDAHVWEYERRKVEHVGGKLLVAESLLDVPQLLQDEVLNLGHG